MKQDKWLAENLSELEKQSSELHPKDYSFYQIDRWKRICERTSEFSDSCRHCTDNQSIITNTILHINQSVNGKPADKRKLEQTQEMLLKHLKKEHNIFPINYFVSRFSFFFLLVGSLLGLLGGMLLREFFSAFLIAGSSLGLISGYVLGTKKDMDARLRKRLI